MREMEYQAPFSEAKWIWVEGNQKKNDLCIFRRTFTVEARLKHPVLRVAADTHYFLNINNNFIVWQGGINHTAGNAGGYYDEIDVGKYIKKGENALAIICHYYGNTGGCSMDKGKAGLIAELVSGEKIVFSSNSEFSAYRNESFKDIEEKTSVNFAGFSYLYDATIERPLSGIYLPSYNSNIFTKAAEICDYGDAPFGELTKRTIPNYRFNHKVKYLKKEKREKDSGTDIYKMSLTRAMNVFPVLSAKALGMEKIKIYTDRTLTKGDFGDNKEYIAPHMEYICKAQKQLFESFVGIYGQNIYIEVPKSVKIAKIGYRFCEYDSEEVSRFDCSDNTITDLAQKCSDTLKACLHDCIINNPERDRAMTLDAANIATKTLLMSFDANAHALVKKTVADILDNISDGIIFGNVPSNAPKEVPFEGLLTISGQGMFAAYSDYFSDLDQRFLTAVVDYLSKWTMSDGLIVPRGGHTDNLFNIDSVVLENALYYSALQFAKSLASKTGCHEYDEFIDSRFENFRTAFEDKFFSGIGYGSNPSYCDDRANAFAVLTGLCGQEKYDNLSELLVSVQNASPYMEGFVLEALCKMGKNNYAQRRMASRYAGMTQNDSSTLSEDFCLGGAQTSSRSVMPLAVLLEYFAGVSISKGGSEITISPDLGDLSYISFSCATPGGTIKGEYKLTGGDDYEFVIHNDSKIDAVVNLKAIGNKSARTYKIAKGKYKYTYE